MASSKSGGGNNSGNSKTITANINGNAEVNVTQNINKSVNTSPSPSSKTETNQSYNTTKNNASNNESREGKVETTTFDKDSSAKSIKEINDLAKSSAQLIKNLADASEIIAENAKITKEDEETNKANEERIKKLDEKLDAVRKEEEERKTAAKKENDENTKGLNDATREALSVLKDYDEHLQKKTSVLADTSKATWNAGKESIVQGNAHKALAVSAFGAINPVLGTVAQMLLSTGRDTIGQYTSKFFGSMLKFGEEESKKIIEEAKARDRVIKALNDSAVNVEELLKHTESLKNVNVEKLLKSKDDKNKENDMLSMPVSKSDFSKSNKESVISDEIKKASEKQVAASEKTEDAVNKLLSKSDKAKKTDAEKAHEKEMNKLFSLGKSKTSTKKSSSKSDLWAGFFAILKKTFFAAAGIFLWYVSSDQFKAWIKHFISYPFKQIGKDIKNWWNSEEKLKNLGMLWDSIKEHGGRLLLSTGIILGVLGKFGISLGLIGKVLKLGTKAIAWAFKIGFKAIKYSIALGEFLGGGIFRGGRGALRWGARQWKNFRNARKIAKASKAAKEAVKAKDTAIALKKSKGEISTLKSIARKKKKLAKAAKAEVKSEMKVASKATAKSTTKAAVKAGGKAASKSLLKKLPIVGMAAGLGFGAMRLMEGDWKGALGEVASGAASMIPVVGPLASLAIDAGLAVRDAKNAAEAEQQKAIAEKKEAPETAVASTQVSTTPAVSPIDPSYSVNNSVSPSVLDTKSLNAEMIANAERNSVENPTKKNVSLQDIQVKIEELIVAVKEKQLSVINSSNASATLCKQTQMG